MRGRKTACDVSTLAGKVASLNGTAGLQIRFSAFIEEEADASDMIIPTAGPVITPNFVLSSPLDGTSIVALDVLVNQNTAAAPQNETSIAVNPNNPNRVVAPRKPQRCWVEPEFSGWELLFPRLAKNRYTRPCAQTLCTTLVRTG